MDRFMLPPLQEGYTYRKGNELITQPLLGGMPRQRRTFINPISTIQASVFCTEKEEFDYFWAFWRKKQRNPEKFLWALQSDSYELEDHKVRFNPESLQESQRFDLKVKYTFELFVVPLNRPAELDDLIVDYWNAGFNPRVSNLLEKLANEALPDALGV